MNRLTEIRTPYAIIDAAEKGIGFPFLLGREGMFTRRFGLDVIIDDILAIIHITPGEYPNDPELGVGIVHYLFELEGTNMLLDLESEIEKQINKYIKNVKLIGIEASAIGELKEILITIRFQKKDGSKDVIRMNYSINNSGSGTLEAGREVA